MNSKFCANTWQSVITENLEVYKLVYTFLSSNEFVSKFINETTRLSIPLKIELLRLIELGIKNEKKSRLLEGELSFSRQNIVLISSYFDLIIKEFAFCYFQLFPNTMIEYINDGDERYKGYIQFKDVISSKDLNMLVINLAKTSSDKFCNGSPDKIFKRFKKLFKSKYEFRNEKEIIDLIKLRNIIIHEDPKHFVSMINVNNGYKYLSILVEDLNDIALDNEFSDCND